MVASDHCPSLPVLVVVEGIFDIHFLKSISTTLHLHDPRLPDLTGLETQKQVLFLPAGGQIRDWAQRVASLGKPEFHLYDREDEPETSERRQVVDAINQRPGCVAGLMQKRALENYLHPSAIVQVCGIELAFDDNSDVAELLARQLLEKDAEPIWQEMSFRSQKRHRNRAKKLLNTRAVKHMTAELLALSDPQGEVKGWLETIGRMAGLTT